MATVTVPTTSTLPVAGGDIIAAPLNGWITNLKTFVEGSNIDENNVDYSNSDGIVVMGQAQTITGLKTFENTSAAAGGVRTAAIFSIDPTSGTPTDGDGVEILFQADDDEGNVATIAELEAIMTDTDNGDEDSEVKIKALIAGSAAEFMVAGTPADGAGRVVFNDASADIDFRIETNNIANGFVVDAALDVFAFGAAGADDKFVTISPPAAAHATTVDTYALHVTAGGAQTIPSGTTALVASVAIEEPNITATGTVTSAATLYIKNAPTEGGSNYALWVDAGAAKFDSTVTIPDGSLTLGSTAVTSTAAEINLIDGGTARGTDAVASGDGLLVNDGGTMKMTNVDTVSTYFSSHSVGGSNIVTTGTVTSGTWSGVIDGSATITMGSDATGDMYYRAASTGYLTRLAAGSDGTVLTGTGAGSVPAWETPTVGDITSVVAGVGLSGGGTTGDVTLTLDISELSTVTPADGDFFATLDSDGANEQKTTTTALATLFAGAGMTATSAVLNVIGGDGITANSNDVAITAAQTTVTSVLNASLAVGRDADNQIKFGTDDQIVFEVAGGDGVTFKASGEIEATSLDISGDADIDGTLEADAITLGGTALGSLYSPIAGSSSITTTGTVTTGTWSGVIDGSATMTLGSDATGDIYYRDASGFLERLGASTDGYVLTTGGAGTVPAWEAAAASGISWDGSTANGVATFKDGDEATVESNLTFDGTTLNVVGNAGVGIARTEGTLHVTTAAVSGATAATNADDLVVENSAAGGISILTPNANDGILKFGSPALDYNGSISVNHNDAAPYMDLNVNSARRMRVSSGGTVLIPTINGSPSLELGVTGVSNALISAPEAMYFSIDSNNDQTDRAYYFGHNANTTSATVLMKLQEDGKLGLGTASPSAKLHVAQSAIAQASMIYNSHASVTSEIVEFRTVKAANSNFRFLLCRDSDAGDVQFNLQGDGNGLADGTWQDNAADYAEYFESTDGEALELGKSVVLENGKVRVYADADSVDDIIGIVRPKGDAKGPSAHGLAWNHWHDKYLTDDWGVYIREDVTVWEWVEVIAVEKQDEVLYVEGDELPDGKSLGDVKTEAIIGVEEENTAVYERDQAEDWTPPEGAVSSTQSIRKLNPEYSVEVDDETNYSPRADRNEWNLIGLLGQVQIKADEPTRPTWIKMKNVSDAVEMWMIR